MPELAECSVCGGRVSTAATTCPHCGQGLRPQRTGKTFGRILLFGAIGFVLVVAFISGDEGDKVSAVGAVNAPPVDTTNMTAEELEANNARFRLSGGADNDASSSAAEPQDAAVADEQARKAAEEAENRRLGFHCLSAWNGSHRAFANLVKDQLRNPKSFEHMETRVSPVKPDGRHAIIMTFRAENGFGGMTVENAVGFYDHETCTPTLEGIGG